MEPASPNWELEQVDNKEQKTQIQKKLLNSLKINKFK